MPALSVLLPVLDAGPWLAPSLASLTRQTFGDFEIVAVDDGSTDGSAERLHMTAAREPRLRVLEGPRQGLPAALAFALRESRAGILVRHDADDLSHRERFEQQRAWLDEHPDTDVVGCRLKLFPAASAGMQRWATWNNSLITHEAIAREALIDSPLAHGTAMMRREAVERAGGWIERGVPEDVDLWLRMLAGGARFAKLPRTLYSWRQHAASATRRHRRYSAQRYAELRRDALCSGWLRGREAVTVIGVGLSLETWTRDLEAAGPRVHAIEMGKPRPGWNPSPPLVLVFGAAPARARWRRHLESSGLRELDDFIFVA